MAQRDNQEQSNHRNQVHPSGLGSRQFFSFGQTEMPREKRVGSHRADIPPNAHTHNQQCRRNRDQNVPKQMYAECWKENQVEQDGRTNNPNGGLCGSPNKN